MRRKKDRQFIDNATINNSTYNMYLTRLCDLAISCFNWVDLPDTVNERYLELLLMKKGKCIFFKDDVLGYIVTDVADNSKLNIYNEPIKRIAIASNGYYNDTLNEENSVIIYNDYMHNVIYPILQMYAWRLYNITRVIDVNISAQRTPVTILCDEKNKLTMENMYMQYEGNTPFIFGNKNLDLTNFKVLNTNAPMIGPQCYDILKNIWNDALMFLGYSPISDKRERMLTEELKQQFASSSSNYFSRLSARLQSCKYINNIFGLNVDVEFRQNQILPTNEEVNSTDE